MTFVACIITVMVNRQPEIYAATGDIIAELSTVYVVDFRNSVEAIDNVSGDYSTVLIKKDLCIKKEKH